MEGEKEIPKKTQGTFKRLQRAAHQEVNPKSSEADNEGRKRGRREEEDMEVEDLRKVKCSRAEEVGVYKQNEVGPADRLCDQK